MSNRRAPLCVRCCTSVLTYPSKNTSCRTWDRSVFTSVKGRTPQRIPSVFVKCQRNLSFSTFAAIWISSRLSLCFVIANAKAKLFLGQIYLANNLHVIPGLKSVAIVYVDQRKRVDAVRSRILWVTVSVRLVQYYRRKQNDTYEDWSTCMRACILRTDDTVRRWC